MMEDLKDKSTYISYYVQSERTFTEDELAELKELIERMKQEPLMFLEPIPSPEPPLPPMREQLTMKWNTPPKDMVEVVRCKDCKYFDSGTDEDGKLFFKCLGRCYGGTTKNDFCSHGERKDG